MRDLPHRWLLIVSCRAFLLVLMLSNLAAGQGYDPVTAPQRMQVPAGLSVNLFASEPEVRQPILVKCDDRGRVWVIQYLQYPNPAGLKRIQVDRYSRTVYDRIPEPPPHGPWGADRITILDDTNGDGRADQVKDFVQGLNLVTGLAFGHGGVFVLQVPYLLFYPDRNRDDVPDSDPEVLLTGFGMEDAQSFANHLTWGPDGWLYGVNGSTTTCRIRGLEFQQGVWRYHPLRKEFELFCEGGGNLFGLTFDARGNLFYSSNGNFLFFHGIQGAYFPKNYGKHGPLHNLYAYGTLQHVPHTGRYLGPTTGGTVYLGDSFPQEFRHSFIAGNFLGHSASWWKVRAKGSTFEAEMGGNLLESNDTWFGATDVCTGPDGAVYVCDFHDQRTAHPDPDAQWDLTNGRVYRIQATNAPVHAPIDLGKVDTPELIDFLTDANGWLADQARSQLAARRDSRAVTVLERRFSQEPDELIALQFLWALYVSGGWNEAVGIRALEHTSEYVRAWSIRLIGDTKVVSNAVGKRLLQLAQRDDSVIVRAQLAALARRLNGEIAIAITAALLDRNQDKSDLNIPWLLWWALEEKAVTSREQLLSIALRPETWEKELWRANLQRLMRRYAAEGTNPGYASCLRILDSTPESELAQMLKQLDQGLSERNRSLGGMGKGDLYDNLAANSPAPTKDGPKEGTTQGRGSSFALVSDPLRARILKLWQAAPNDSTRLRLALQTEELDPYQHLLKVLTLQTTAEPVQLVSLQLLAEFGKVDAIPTLLSYLSGPRSESLRRASFTALARFSDPRVTQFFIESYAKEPVELQSQLRSILFARAPSALAFLQLVEQRVITADKVPLDQVRLLAHHKDPKIDAIVRVNWGTVREGTAEEKLAEIRRLNNDLRATAGVAKAGAEHFKKHCGTCHKRMGEGGVVGPDLTAVSKDRNFLLTSLVDPSVVIRSQYLAYVVTTESGQILTGTIVEQDAASITLMDAKAQTTKLTRDRIVELRESSTSLMPDNILNQLTPQQLRDLFAFLES